MKMIVTGGAGFIGSNFIFHMLDKHPSYELICVDKLTYAGNLETLAPVMDDPRFKFSKTDIADRKAIYALFEEEKPDVVVNFAAESHVDRSIENPSVFLETNVMGTQVLLDACRIFGIQRYHQVSTDEVYGDLPLDRPDLFFTEQTPIHTSSPYSASKANPAAYASVMDCRCAAVCGGTGALCVVLAGSEAQPNAYFWNGSHIAMDPGYFPMPQYQLAGDSSDPITAFGKQQSYLIVLKEHSIGRTAVSETKLDGRATLDMPFVPINSELGCDKPGTLCLVENNLVWAHSRHGVLRLRDTSAAYENNVVCISRKVNGGGAVKGLLEDLKEGPACACDDGHRYLLAASGHAWVWDYELSEPGDPAWFYWTEIGARAFAVDGERVCHLDEKGRLSAFERVYADYGRAIEKVYRFATEHFGGYDRLKNVNSVVLVMRSDTNATASLSYITDHERREDRSELRAWSWMLSPRNLSFRSLRGRGFASVFRRSCRCRGVRHFAMRLSNNRVGQDLSVVSAQVFYNYQGRQR